MCVHAKVLQPHDTSFNSKIDISFRGSAVALKYRSSMNTNYFQTVTIVAGGTAASFMYFNWYLTALTQKPTGNSYTGYRESSFIGTSHQTMLPCGILARLLQIQASWTTFFSSCTLMTLKDHLPPCNIWKMVYFDHESHWRDTKINWLQIPKGIHHEGL